MKLHTERTEVERVGVANESTFRIKTTAKAFDILSSGLYTDPKLAIVRELACNAYDAHTAAGTQDTPFEIHLPNALEPWFHVRDFGTGLSDKDVMTLYTTYFDSTKTDSNAFIGALGLGSKSPFSYTKAFEVISRHNGKRRIYSAFINEDGLPSIARLGEFDTDEPNGLEVRIAIQKEDFSVFADRTARALRWFPVKPKITGVTYFEHPVIPAARVEGDGWKVFDVNFSRDYSKMTAVQGNVGYKVDISKIGLGEAEQMLMEKIHVVGFFEIGELEVAANREEIRYDERSKAALVTKITDVRKNMIKSIEERIDGLPDTSFWNVTIELNKISDEVFGDLRIFRQFLQGSTHPNILRYLSNRAGELPIPQLLGHTICGYEQSFSTRGGGMTAKRVKCGSGLRPDTNIKVFINDMQKGGITRVMEWVRTAPRSTNHRPTTAIVISRIHDFVEIVSDPTDPTKRSEKDWTEADYQAELVALIDSLGDVQLLKASVDGKIPPRAAYDYRNNLPVFRFAGMTGSRYSARIEWARVKPDFDAGGIYFHLQNGSKMAHATQDGNLITLPWHAEFIDTHFKSMVAIANRHLGTSYGVHEVVGVGHLAYAKIKKNPNWVNLFDVLREAAKSYTEAAKFLVDFTATPDCRGIKDRIASAVANKDKVFFGLINKLPDNSTFKKNTLPLIEDYKKYHELLPSITFMKRLDVDLHLGIVDSSNAKPYFTEKNFDVYPMFSMVSDIEYMSTHDLNKLFDYINLIDRS